jgi:hypothetical protein
LAPRVAAVGLAILLGLAGLAGCADEEHRLPTADDGQAPTGPDLAAIGRGFYDCMRDADLPVLLLPNATGELALVLFDGQGEILWRDGNGNGGGLPGDTNPGQEFERRYDEVMGRPDDQAVLIVDGVDQSQAYASCLARTGYNEDTARGRLPVENNLVQAEQQVRSNNLWAACARDNGFPTVVDSVLPEQPDGVHLPTIVLPGSITEGQLRLLFQACPFATSQPASPPDQASRAPATAASESLPAPSIVFDHPRFTDANWSPSPQDAAEVARLDQLVAIVQEQESQWQEAQNQALGGESGPIGGR